MVARTCLFVPVSSFIAGELTATGVKAEQIEMIYGHPPRRVGNEAPSTIPPLGAAVRDIVFVGQIVESKGPNLVIEAFRSLAKSHAQARLLIAGRISEWSGDKWARDLRDSVSRDPVLQSRVIFLGFVENVPDLLRGRELLIVPSLVEEGLPLVVLEAKIAGIPSIVFPSGGLPEVIRHGEDGFVCRDKSISALVEALGFYLDDPSVAARQSAAARASLQRLGVSEFARRWLAVYERAG